LIPLIHIREPDEASSYYDNCIGDSANGLIYALSWYLNIVCPDWEILVTEDHTAVMPLPVNRSFGRRVLSQPDFAWQLGIFSTGIPSAELIHHFMHSIPPAYRFKRLCLNKFNIIPSGQARYLDSAELDLIRPYTVIRSRYGPYMQRMLESARDNSLSYVGNTSVHDMLMFASRLDKFSRSRLNPRNISCLRLIATKAIHYRQGQIGTAYDSHNNLCATVLFLVFKGRASILYAAASGEGLNSGGIEFIIDRFIEANAEENLVLCTDNSANRKLMDILKACGSGLSAFPCLKRIS
jgi:hypothetical protein